MLISRRLQQKAIDGLLDAYTNHRIGRRAFLKSAVATGMSFSVATSLLTACEPGNDTPATIDVLSVWVGEEQSSFNATVAPFMRQTGVKINLESTRDLNVALATRLNGNDPPDIIVTPSPSKLSQLASQNQLLNLDTFLDMDNMRKVYSSYWLDLASYQDKLYALVLKVANKGTIWYNPKQFHDQHYPIPSTWDDLLELSDMIVQRGGYPWSLGVENATASGWPAADWIAEIYLKEFGSELYDRWVKHQIPWTDSTIKHAFQLFGQIIGGKHYIAGAPLSVLETTYTDACYQPFWVPPQAYMNYLGDFASGFILNQFPHTVPGSDFDFFPFPTLNAQDAHTVTVGADLVAVMRDSDVVRQLLTYLSTAQSQTIWVKRGGATSVNQDVDLGDYPNDVARRSASMLINEQNIFRFGADDLMPPSVQQAFWQGMLTFINDQNSLDVVLKSIEDLAQQTYAL